MKRDLDVLDVGAPVIAPVAAGVVRPFWSVMIPTYNPGASFEIMLRSLLEQDRGAEQMQITVVDDGSTKADVPAALRRIAGDRIEFIRNPKNLGLAGNWNRCVELARGQVVHILHQDDLLTGPFYQRLEEPLRSDPNLAAAFCRHAFIDASGQTTHVVDEEQNYCGVWENFRELAYGQRIQCAAIAVRREVYQKIGGFLPDLVYTLDWEMWMRIAIHGPVWYDTRIMAAYRLHRESETERLDRQGLDWRDMIKATQIMRRYLPRDLRRAAELNVRMNLGLSLIKKSAGAMEKNDWRGGMNYLSDASSANLRLPLTFQYWDLKHWAAQLWMRELLKSGSKLSVLREGIGGLLGFGRRFTIARD